MQDGIIKGTGNSRYLKSISNFLTQYPAYQDFVAALVAGTLPIDLNGINETGWDQLGTALNKANLLSDETATALGLESDAVPDDALNALGAQCFRFKKLAEHTFEDATDQQIAYIDLDMDVINAQKPHFLTVASGIANNNRGSVFLSFDAEKGDGGQLQAGKDYSFNLVLLDLGDVPRAGLTGFYWARMSMVTDTGLSIATGIRDGSGNFRIAILKQPAGSSTIKLFEGV